MTNSVLMNEKRQSPFHLTYAENVKDHPRLRDIGRYFDRYENVLESVPTGHPQPSGNGKYLFVRSGAGRLQVNGNISDVRKATVIEISRGIEYTFIPSLVMDVRAV